MFASVLHNFHGQIYLSPTAKYIQYELFWVLKGNEIFYQGYCLKFESKLL